jgi:uncharacterized repeat protein (TIGR01451 family)
MFPRVSVAFLAVCLIAAGHSPTIRAAAPGRDLAAPLPVLPLAFIENRGQMDRQVAYYVQGAEASAYFTAGAMTLTLTSGGTGTRTGGSAKRWVVRQEFLGSDPGVAPTSHALAPGRVSYFKGARSAWTTGLRTFASVDYRALWPGIDLSYGGRDSRLEYTFVVQPGADPRRIRLAYDGIERAAIDGHGQLELGTPVRTFHDERPTAFQEIDGRRVPVEVAFEISTVRDRRVVYGFRLGRYDATRALVIDPAVLVYAGYVGGEGGSAGFAIAVHDDSAFLVGATQSTPAQKFPLTVGPDLTFNGNVDAYIAKVRADGTGLEYCGYIGGSNVDHARGVAVDSLGYAYVTGLTGSTDFPVVGSLGTSYAGGPDDAFVVRVTPDGSALDYAGYIGGANDDVATGIAVDAGRNAYIAGYTTSDATTLPVSVGPGLVFHGGPVDAFVAKVNATGSALEYCGYIGGNDTDQAWGVAVDALGSAYVVGSTWSDEKTFPKTGGPKVTLAGGMDAFVAKVNPAGTGLAYAGYIGGAFPDEARGVAVDALGNAYVVGTTSSKADTFPVLVGPRTTKADVDQDAFIAKVNTLGGLVYAGYVGGDHDEFGFAVGVDGAGSAYITGFTNSPEATFPVLDGPQMTLGGDYDGYIAKVKPDGSALEYCSYIGGSGFERSWGIAVSPSGDAYLGGDTDSKENSFPVPFPVTVGPDLTFPGPFVLGNRNAFVAKFSVTSTGAEADVSVVKTAGPDPIVLSGTVVYNILVTNNGPAVATDIQVTDLLPAPLVTPVLGPAVCNNANPLKCVIASLDAGQSALLTMAVKPTAVGPLTNSVMVSAQQTDLDPANNSATVTTTVEAAAADLSVVKTAFLGTDSIGYQIAVTNNGPSDATSVTLVDTLPANVTFLFSPDPQCGLPVAGKVTCQIGNVPSGNIATMTLVVAHGGGPKQVDNQACASAAEPDPVPGNDCGSSTTIVPPPPPPPPQKIKKLIVDIGKLVDRGALSKGEGTSLTAKLTAAVAALDLGRVEPARHQLLAFVNEVEALRRSRRLDPETSASLVAAAGSILDGLTRGR